MNEFAYFFRPGKTASGHYLLYVSPAHSVVNETRPGIVRFTIQVVRCDCINRYAKRRELDAQGFDKRIRAGSCYVWN